MTVYVCPAVDKRSEATGGRFPVESSRCKSTVGSSLDREGRTKQVSIVSGNETRREVGQGGVNLWLTGGKVVKAEAGPYRVRREGGNCLV